MRKGPENSDSRETKRESILYSGGICQTAYSAFLFHELAEYDSLYHAADCRAKADWLVGMNASQALAKASGTFNQSLGRVQTPILTMIYLRDKREQPECLCLQGQGTDRENGTLCRAVLQRHRRERLFRFG